MMKLSNQEIQECANELWDARVYARPIAALTTRWPEMAVESAYLISGTNDQRRLSSNARPIGKKIGLTSRAVQKQLGVDQPDFGYLTSDMLISNGGTVPPGQLIQPRIEGEVAFFLKRSLSGPGVTFSQVVEATDYVVACIEIIDSRVQDWKIKIQDTIADNASSALIVLGSEKRSLKDLDLRMAGMALRIDGEVESTGVGMACLDHPVIAVQWLANALGVLGETLKAEDLILSGAYGPVVPISAGRQCEVEINGLGKVACRF